ncbi:MAG: phosphoribosylformylglycinamidine cyclo-ligase [Candidatus Nealsonbacteria bacterium CG02_land_8_20_14_3_00_37_10]|uniref:Phosphoribosylformylglycinamidine cyclo-ligase n=1 Tax=Candidatus Nealsonbacteria bacterium CG02_land_8_20_14_3_00_37_10 TaxID=1974699 RepID=A0A2M7DA34_9BACT|nr:MAG: phosphoribosylformylglycinamidine cyclo-ligase [Candidatus Nealsonbacteria bacterium CG02_land_8_20_14_3_00_37_10]
MVTYAKAGVNRKLREKAKRGLKSFELTYKFQKYGKVIKAPFNVLYPISKNRYQTKVCDGIGTKVLLAQLANKHDTIGIDAVAMVVNDCIRCGAKPIAITDMIDVKKSEPKVLGEIQKGLILGAKEAGCPIVGGEIADLPELLNAVYHINCDCVGEVKKKDIITGQNLKPGDIVIGFRSSGVHSNGLTLARKVLFKKWGGKFDAFEKPEGLKKSLVYECLEPTKIYVNPFLKIAERFEILGAIHITGDAYLKFKKLMRNFGFEFFNFKPQPVFNLIQEAGKISDKEMFRTFNMGWGFAIVVKKENVNKILDLLEKLKVEAEVIGKVSKKKKIIINYQDKKLIL